MIQDFTERWVMVILYQEAVSRSTTCLQLDDIRFYNYAMTTANVEELLCRGRPKVDCIGLLGHWTFEQDTMDVSGAGWHGSLRQPARAAAPEDSFPRDAKQGRYSLRLSNIPSIRGAGRSTMLRLSI